MVPVLAGEELLLVSKHYQEISHKGDGAISLQSFQEAALIHIVVCLLEVQEDQEKGVLFNTIQILCQIKPQDDHPRSPPCAEAMKDVMEAESSP